MNGSTPDSEQLKEELEKLRLAKEVLAAERELELEARRVTAERQAEADELAREVALHEAEEERLSQEIAEAHARSEAKAELLRKQQKAKSKISPPFIKSRYAKFATIIGAIGLTLFIAVGGGVRELIDDPEYGFLPLVVYAIFGAIIGFIVGELIYKPPTRKD